MGETRTTSWMASACFGRGSAAAGAAAGASTGAAAAASRGSSATVASDRTRRTTTLATIMTATRVTAIAITGRLGRAPCSFGSVVLTEGTIEIASDELATAGAVEVELDGSTVLRSLK